MPKAGKKKSKSTSFAFGGAKRKKARARVIIREGTGQYRINGRGINSISNKYIRDMLTEPLDLSGKDVSKLDILVNVSGGGIMGQVDAIRGAVARALVKYFNDPSLESHFFGLEKSYIVNDVRQVESKKYRRRKARAKYQKSYR
ncbi:MAG: 30S ribosomal protein S9 [Candidatus Anstonellales archaeon]